MAEKIFRQILIKFIIIFIILPVNNGQHDISSWSDTADNSVGGKCSSGNQQSPIDIQANNVIVEEIEKLNFINYNQMGPIQINNNGATVTISGFDTWNTNQPYIFGSRLKYNYKLAHFHIHWSQNDENGSEHTFEGRRNIAEIHLLHLKEGKTLEESLLESDGIAVVAVMLQIGENSVTPLASFENAFETMLHPLNKDQNVLLNEYTPDRILPKNTESFFTYNGSLTTPNCNEAVIWTILSEPAFITSSQLFLLRDMRARMDGTINANVREIQPLNNRLIYFRPSLRICKSKNIFIRKISQPWCSLMAPKNKSEEENASKEIIRSSGERREIKFKAILKQRKNQKMFRP